MKSEVLNSCSLYVNYSESPFKNRILDILALYTLCCLQLVEIKHKTAPIFASASSTKLRQDRAGKLTRSLARLSMQYLSEGRELVFWLFYFHIAALL